MFASPYSTGSTYFDNGYQPNTINGSKLKKTGTTVGDTGLKGSTSFGGKNMDSQNIWKDTAGNQWIWIRTGDKTGYYIQYHPEYKGAVDFSGGNSASYDNYMVSTAAGTKVTNKINWGPESTPTTDTTTGGGGGYAAPYIPYPDMSRYTAEIEALQRELAELKRPRSAKELAEIYGLTDQYNEENILRDYNEATNQYYDTAVAEQNKLRTNYARNNATYVDRVADAYLDSYKNSAPTAVGRGTRAANTLSTLLQAEQTNASNDYGMMQSVNNLEEARKAELAANPDLARQYYNSIGTYLSTLSATLNQSDVKQYVDSLDAYASRYADDRKYQAYLAQSNAARYAGLANAASANASSAADNSAWYQLYNYYLTTNKGNTQIADSNIANLLKSSTGK